MLKNGSVRTYLVYTLPVRLAQCACKALRLNQACEDLTGMIPQPYVFS